MVKIEEQTKVSKHSRRNWLRLAGLIMGLIGAAGGFVAFLWWGRGVWQQVQFQPEEWLFIVLSFVRCGVVGIAWKWQLIGGLLLILDSLFVATFLSYAPLRLLLSVCIPLLASGIAFLLLRLLLWKDRRKQA